MDTSTVRHADYPHTPGTLYGCIACETRCYCGLAGACVGCQTCRECSRDLSGLDVPHMGTCPPGHGCATPCERHSWVSGMMRVDDEDVHAAAVMRAASGSSLPECERCDAIYDPATVS